MRTSKRIPDSLGAIRRDEILPVRVAARWLGWNRASIVNSQRGGVKTVQLGRFKITTGQAIYEYVEKMMRVCNSIEG
jgi:hypothetical protein